MNINYVDNLKIQGKKVILVGSSASILDNNNLDDLNDEENFIIRFNRAPIKGYENIVGEKTDLRAVNCHVFDNSEVAKKHGYDCQDKYFVKNLRNSNILYIAPRKDPLLRKDFNCHESNNLYIFNYEKINDLKIKIGYKYSNQMTIGAVVMSLLVVSEINPYIIGFDTDLNKVNNRTHYFENRPKKSGASHNVTNEINFFNKLIEDKKVFKL